MDHPGWDQARILGHIDEAASRLVAIQRRALISGDQKVGIAVVIVVAHGRAMAVVGRAVEADLGRDVAESPVAEVSVQSIGPADQVKPEEDFWNPPAAREEQVGPTIAVEIEDGDATPQGLQDRAEARLLAVVVGEVDPRLPRSGH